MKNLNLCYPKGITKIIATKAITAIPIEIAK